MDHLHLSPSIADHLLTLLARTTSPSTPSLAPGSRTAAALERAGLSWSDAHQRAESALLDHARDVRRFAERVVEVDRGLF
ncbi:MAG: hypothetical protein Q4G50_08665 [Corynebacterium sp.]|uniref:hypothetical protein n=1 Tax=Corynebacterium sp. TaxID=1720 RepID=UPI0026E0DE2B|nr:hypothetical protein [Corynebacterium sp.]MDO5670061.1 hypothetical protein [Corynebacterium sp.]